MQFLKCKFFGSNRAYTYKNPGDPVRIGDYVDVSTPQGGIQSVEVVELLTEEPNVSFEIKSIQGLSASSPGE